MTRRRRPGRFGTEPPAQGQVEPEVSVPPPVRPAPPFAVDRVTEEHELHDEPCCAVEPAPSPATASIPPGVVCRVYVGTSHCYSTKRMQLDDAKAVAAQVYKGLTDRVGVIVFPSAQHEQVGLPREQIRAVEVIRVDALQRQAPNPSPGRVAS